VGRLGARRSAWAGRTAPILEHVEHFPGLHEVVLPSDTLELPVVVLERVETQARDMGLLEQVEALGLDRIELAAELGDPGHSAVAPQTRKEKRQPGAGQEQGHPMAARQLEPIGHACL
jgi:hypothetical protein